MQDRFWFRAILAGLVAVAVLVPVSGTAQRRPDLSGHWVLVTATTTGGRTKEKSGTPKASGEVPTTSTTVSGAAFNCGSECTILQKGPTLTVDQAHLGSNPKPAPAVTLSLDGSQTSVIDSFNPDSPRKIPVTAKWDGSKLEITSATGSHAYTQLVSIEAAQLVVVTSINIEGGQPLTLRYKKK
jgi:hypothetical protein